LRIARTFQVRPRAAAIVRDDHGAAANGDQDAVHDQRRIAARDPPSLRRIDEVNGSNQLRRLAKLVPGPATVCCSEQRLAADHPTGRTADEVDAHEVLGRGELRRPVDAIRRREDGV